MRLPESRARLGRWLLAVVVVASALGLGALHTQVLVGCLVLATIATALLWFDTQPLEPRPAATLLFGVAVALIAFTALQIVPLPRGVLAAIAGETADVWAHCLSPLHEDGPSSATLSLDPHATRVQILRGVTYLVVFAGALRVARRQDGVTFLERTIVVSALAIAGAALVHPALGARKVFGLYEPVEAYSFDPHHLAPILNTNHLAAYVNIGLMIAFGAVIERRESMPRPLAIAIVVLLAPVTVWTLSRGGIASMTLGVLLCGVLVFGARRSRRSEFLAPTAVLVSLVGGSVVLLFAMFEESREKFINGDLSKVELIKTSFGLVRDFPIFGAGRGAFESTFPHLRKGTEYWVNTNPENVIAQWMTEWGAPVAIAAMLAIAWALRPRTALTRSRTPAGAWAALVAVAAHNLVDFSSELPGVMIAMCVCAAIVTGGSGPPQSKRPTELMTRLQGWARRPNALVFGLAGLSAVAIAISLPKAAHELYNEQRAFREIGLDRSLTRDAFHAQVREAMLRHPAEPYFPFVGAVRASVIRDESVLPWASRALDRSPIYGRVHLLLARSLFSKNPSQARLEYRLACWQDSQMCMIQESARLVGGFEEAMELVPEGRNQVWTISRLSEVLGQRLPSTVVRLDREIADRDPGALPPVLRTADAALKDIRNEETWCDATQRQACVADGLAAARRLQIAAPDKCDGHALRAELRIASGEVDPGFSELDNMLDQVTERSACARRLVQIAMQTNNNARVDASLERLLKLGCESQTECVNNFVFAADVETRRGSNRRAFALTKKAWERAPERDDLLIDVATKAAAAGMHGEALDAYTKLVERHPENPKWSEAVAREKQALSKSVFERRPP